uniref:Anion exchange protein n=1 Tax=Ursus americanus TaxID=9643 RepID=A0A452RVU2_URSAM
PSRTQAGRGSPGGLAPILRRKKKKKQLDRRPHEVFVELNELTLDRSQEPHWRETARWIKFEEDVEEETERWGKPHVASLSFRSLLELRRTIAHGAALLDLEQTTLPGIAHLVVETMIVSDQIRPEDRASVLRTLLLKHSHPNDDKDSGFFPRNPSSSSVNSVLGNHHPTPSHGPDGAVPTMADDVGEASLGSSSLPSALCLTVPPGCVPFLEQPAAAFVRLNEAVLLESVLEVPVPVRFLFVMLGPNQTSTDYHELGRSIATLMSDKLFHEAAYQADDRQDLLSAISEFLDGSIVIPPSEVEGRDLLRSVAAFQRELLRKRREREQTKVEMTTQGSYVVFTEHPLLPFYPPEGTSEAGLELNGSAVPPTEGLPGPRNQPNTALLSLILMLGTFLIAFFLRKFRNSRFLGGKARRIIGDFGIPISILVMVLVDYSITDTYTQKLTVPTGLSVTSPHKRTWFIPPLGSTRPFPPWMMVAAAVPALLVLILIFMETQITALIVSQKARRLLKGSGFHLDLLLIGSLGGLCGLFGLPWLTAATVRSVTHVNALTVMRTAIAPGDKPQIQEVREQRVTGVLIASLVGLSIVMGAVLRRIPLAVLFGIFLYMGVTSLSGIQLSQRLLLILMPAKHHPEQPYVTKVKTWRMHLFTCIQLSCIALLWVVKSTAASLAFPFLLLLTVPLRRCLLPRLFQDRELQALDSEDAEPNFDEDGQDEYNELHMPV